MCESSYSVLGIRLVVETIEASSLFLVFVALVIRCKQ